MNTCDREVDRWLDVLAGRCLPQDADTRQAAALRVALREMHRAYEPMDEASVGRMLERMRARGAFSAPPTPPPTRLHDGAVRQVLAKAWPGLPSSSWLAALLTAVLASTATAWLVDRGKGHGADSEELRSKQAVASIIHSADPRTEALELGALLTRLGAQPQLEALGSQWAVRAQLPVERLQTYERALIPFGLVVPPGGQLDVRFTH